MAKPNYQFEKRQRDLRKKQKQEAKRQRKVETRTPAVADSPDAEAGTTGKPDAVPSAEKPGES